MAYDFKGSTLPGRGKGEHLTNNIDTVRSQEGSLGTKYHLKDDSQDR